MEVDRRVGENSMTNINQFGKSMRESILIDSCNLAFTIHQNQLDPGEGVRDHGATRNRFFTPVAAVLISREIRLVVTISLQYLNR